METWQNWTLNEIQLDLDSLIFTINNSLGTKIINWIKHMAHNWTPTEI